MNQTTDWSINPAYSKECLRRLSRAKGLRELGRYLSAAEREHVRQQAERLKQHIFVFDKPWDMERCLIPFQISPGDFQAQRNDDEEWCFMLNRMDYLSYLILAGVLGDQDSFAAGLGLINAWLLSHPDLKQGPSTRTLDTGIRIMNMMEALPFLMEAGCLEDEVLMRILSSLMEQIRYLRREYLPKYTLSNWGSIQTAAILSVLPLLREDYRRDPIYKWAKKEIETQFSIQIYEDGMQWEQSVMYHIEVLNYGVKAVYYQRFYGFSPMETVERQCLAMTAALFAQVTPDGCIEAFGDSDRVEAGDVFARSAALFQNGVWKSGAPKLGAEYHFDMESLYSFGTAFAEQFSALKAEPGEALIYDGTDSGIYCFRSSFDRTASFTMFTHGSLGSGHGHSDNLHLSLYCKGELFLIDTGRFTYREDHPLRPLLKGMTAHNCVLIDEKEYCLPKGSWGYEAFGLPLKTYVRHTGPVHYLEGTMIGHDPLQVWTRKLVVIDPCIWLIADEVKEDGIHRMKQYFHIDPAACAKPGEDGWLLHSGAVSLRLRNEGEAKEAAAPCSLRYNERSDHQVLTFEKSFEDRAGVITCLSPADIRVEKVPILQNLETPVSEDLAQARRFHVSETEKFTVVIFHQELYQGKKICSCEGLPFHAKAAVIHEKGNVKTLWRLKV